MADILPIDIAEWFDMMGSTITIRTKNAQSVSGVPGFGASASYPAYIEMKTQLMVDSKGREVKVRGRAFVGTTNVISVEDEITLPASYTPQKPPMLVVNLADDERGIHHVTIGLG